MHIKLYWKSSPVPAQPGSIWAVLEVWPFFEKLRSWLGSGFSPGTSGTLHVTFARHYSLGRNASQKQNGCTEAKG